MAETQDPNANACGLPVPETDPAMYDRNVELDRRDEGLEIPETQPTDSNYSELEDPDFADLVSRSFDDDPVSLLGDATMS